MVDLDITKLFSGELQRIIPDLQRVVNSKSPRTALQYQKELMQLLGEQNMLKRIERLLEKAATKKREVQRENEPTDGTTRQNGHLVDVKSGRTLRTQSTPQSMVTATNTALSYSEILASKTRRNTKRKRPNNYPAAYKEKIPGH